MEFELIADLKTAAWQVYEVITTRTPPIKPHNHCTILYPMRPEAVGALTV